MGKSKESFNKKEREKKRQKKREKKAEKKALKKTEDKKPDDMIAYVNHNGHLVDEKPVPDKNLEINAEDIDLGHGKVSDLSEDGKHKGKVKFFNEEKGYGFINSMDSTKNYFVHISSLEQTIKEGDNVSFELVDGPQGPQAVNVKVI